jgi:hypothetical protein
MPDLYDLYWDPGSPMGVTVAIAPFAHGATVASPPRIPAAILYPTFFTPAVYFPGDAELEHCFEVLLATPGSVTLTAADVNLRLGITRGLGWRRVARDAPLFASTDGRIRVDRTEPDGNGLLSTHTQFRGRLHPLWNRHLSSDFRSGVRYWRVRVHELALQHAPDADALRGLPLSEPQDDAIEALFRARHGASCRHARTFNIRGHTVHPESPRADRPVLAHHPLAVYPADQRVFRKVGHVSDLHLNMRQQLLAQSNARVIEIIDRHGDPVAEDISPRVGSMVHDYSRSVFGILAALDDDTDAICVGGDLVDHIRNAAPRHGTPMPGNAAAVWDRVALASSTYAANYQAGADFITAFTIFRHICATRQMPMFGITGNHDAYVDGYGISPRPSNNRLLRLLGNEGIAADHNLTLFEAILMFGPTYHEYGGYGDVRGAIATLRAGSSNFHAEWLDWFYTVFTPFADASLRLPAQRVVALGWGESEHMLGLEDDGQGRGHLPRATDGVSTAQDALLRTGFGNDRPTLLLTHFTFASFGETIAESAAAHGGARPEGRIRFGRLAVEADDLRHVSVALQNPYTPFDFGTFTERRSGVYGLLSGTPTAVSAVLTGHSHRKALYMLSDANDNGIRAVMVGMAAGSVDVTGLPTNVRGGLPVVLSDAAGPMPRSNVQNEFAAWGSDRAAGSELSFNAAGRLERVRVVHDPSARKPRAPVAIEYRHFQDSAVWDDAVLEFQSELVLEDGRLRVGDRRFWVPIKAEWDTLGLQISGVALLGRVAAAPGAPGPTQWLPVLRAERTGNVQSIAHRGVVRHFPLWQISEWDLSVLDDWLTIASSSDRFVALQFSGDGMVDRGAADRYDWDAWWTFETMTERVFNGHVSEQWRVLPLEGGLLSAATSSDRPVVDQPDFDFRRRLLPAKYLTPINAGE